MKRHKLCDDVTLTSVTLTSQRKLEQFASLLTSKLSVLNYETQ